MVYLRAHRSGLPVSYTLALVVQCGSAWVSAGFGVIWVSLRGDGVGAC